MSTSLRRFHGEPVTRLIVSVTVSDVARVDRLIERRGSSWAWPGNRSEFVRLAIEEKLEREALARAKDDSGGRLDDE